MITTIGIYGLNNFGGYEFGVDVSNQMYYRTNNAGMTTEWNGCYIFDGTVYDDESQEAICEAEEIMRV